MRRLLSSSSSSDKETDAGIPADTVLMMTLQFDKGVVMDRVIPVEFLSFGSRSNRKDNGVAKDRIGDSGVELIT